MSLLAQACDAARCERLDQARSALDAAQQTLGDLSRRPEWAARLDLTRSKLAYFNDETDIANELALRAHADAVQHGLGDLRCESAGVAALQLAYQDRHAEAVAMAADALRHAAADAHFPRYLALLCVASLCQAFGQPKRAFPLYRQAMVHARARQDRIGFAATIGRMSHQQALDVIHADLHGRLSPEDLVQAVVGMRSSLSIQEQAGQAFDPVDQVALADLLQIQGQWGEVETLLQRCTVDTFPYPPAPYLPARCRATLGLIALRRGAHADAAGHLAAALARLPESGPESFALREAMTFRLVAQLQQQLEHTAAAARSAARADAALRRHDSVTAAQSTQLSRLLHDAGLAEVLLH